MPDTIRKQIVAELKTTLDTIPELIGATQVNTPDILDLAVAELPMAFIDSGDEEINEGENELGGEGWNWRPVVSVYFRVDDPNNNTLPDDFIGLVHSKLYTDRSRAGLANETKRLTGDVIELDSDGSHVQGVLMIFEIDYVIKEGDPYSLPS